LECCCKLNKVHRCNLSTLLLGNWRMQFKHTEQNYSQPVGGTKRSTGIFYQAGRTGDLTAAGAASPAPPWTQNSTAPRGAELNNQGKCNSFLDLLSERQVDSSLIVWYTSRRGWSISRSAASLGEHLQPHAGRSPRNSGGTTATECLVCSKRLWPVLHAPLSAAEAKPNC
jgi:hypothetical protein